jgi:hypothetical protein
MKKQVAALIKLLGITVNELVMDVDLEAFTFNSIEWVPEDNKIILHIWFDVEDNDGEFELDVDFDTLSNEDQKLIYNTLAKLCLN